MWCPRVAIIGFPCLLQSLIWTHTWGALVSSDRLQLADVRAYEGIARCAPRQGPDFDTAMTSLQSSGNFETENICRALAISLLDMWIHVVALGSQLKFADCERSLYTSGRAQEMGWEVYWCSTLNSWQELSIQSPCTGHRQT